MLSKKMNEIIVEIDGLDNQILEKINQGELSEIDLIIEARFNCLLKLIELQENQDELCQYLNKAIQHDQYIMQCIHHEKEKINHIMINLNHLDYYQKTT